MKVLAILEVAPDASIDVIRGELKNELREAWRLYGSGAAHADTIPQGILDNSPQPATGSKPGRGALGNRPQSAPRVGSYPESSSHGV
jgi:hypothetical protein